MGYSPVGGIWSGIGGSSGPGRGKEGLISTFASFLTAFAKVKIFLVFL